MKIRVLALSTVLLLSTGAFAQDNAPANPPSSGSTTQSGMQPNDNNGAMQTTRPGNMDDTHPMGYEHRSHHGGGWGWIGLVGLFGLFGMGGGRRNREVVATSTTLPPR